MKIPEILETLLAGGTFSTKQACAIMDEIMDGHFDEAQIGALLVALRGRGETPEEIAGFARSMRDHASGFEVDPGCRPLVDTCGTGGDSVETVNISTLSALVAAGGGANVAKHGNRSVSSQCGSADILEALGVEIELQPAQVKECIEEVGIGFMYAPLFHSAMRYAIGPRKSLGIRTVFNLLGPLTNPAGADRQLLGVFSPRWVVPVAEALKTLGVERAMVVHGLDGMDEISLSSPTVYAELKNNSIEEGRLQPEDFNLEAIDLDDIAGGTPEQNLKAARSLLSGEANRSLEAIVAANAGAVLYLAGKADTLEDAAELARNTIQEGRAAMVLDKLVKFSNEISV